MLMQQPWSDLNGLLIQKPASTSVHSDVLVSPLMLLLHISISGYQFAGLCFFALPVIIMPPTLLLILHYFLGIQLAHPELPGSFAYTSRKVPTDKQFLPLHLKNLVYLHHLWSSKPLKGQKLMFAAALSKSFCWPGQARPANERCFPLQPQAPL